ncbi:TIGR03749 family integrating conjugative element protein [Klebsiella variicola]|uniref:TIGR03749 family integrating conjugative element protein n=1 Tax=Klebsiella variicola TaxID=244366 RepID=UPI001C80355C|nr:TIGR03749 family integrating conjugative element protein [Klebsiella variicola]MBX4606920.1 TIGR03749 family integrating conjugative element protein [Klebsiella variicola]MBZ7597052.1 TIGR03749 family integrating conjugative element protein [Klebsiella variicola]HBX3103270.1 TIGR03749 family integrating conjugative element protein [Klebsiella pneumoniae]HBY6946706.1 TIGR03749 family integrating conjugative element protein [Klebsiella pneumoniae]
MKRLLLSLALLAPWAVQAVELMKWERIPLPVPLNVGQERIVFVDKNVRVGFPATLNGKMRIQSSGGAVYLQAEEAFPVTRLQLQDLENGELILLDVSARDGKNALEPVRLVYSGEVATASTSHKGAVSGRDASGERENGAAGQGDVKLSAPLPVLLTRYAAQHLYAPLRTVEAVPGISPVSLKPAVITSLLPSEPVETKTLAAWAASGYSVVAVRLKNQSDKPVVLDPRRLQGRFYSATFQHRWLGAQGTPEDTTLLYLVFTGRPENAFLPSAVMAKKGGR